MALIDDIFGIILVVFFLIIVSIILTSQILSDQARVIDEKQEFYLFDYYSTSINAFINVQENRTGVPMHILLGNYVKLGEDVVLGRQGEEVNVLEAGEDVLIELFGEDNFYLELRRSLVDTTISFVLDGSNSNAAERQEISNNFDLIREAIEEYFEEESEGVVSPDIRVYILNEDNLCDREGFEGDYCTYLSFDDLYDASVVEKPSFGFDSFDEWNSAMNQNGQRHIDFMVADWMAGIAYAHKEFLSELEEDDENIHIILPVSDQLSTGSVSNRCYGEVDSPSNYIICRYCLLEECPVERSNASMSSLIDFLVDEDDLFSTFVVPVFSEIRSFFYFESFNRLEGTGEFAEFFSEDHQTKCHISNCDLCEYPGGSEVDWITVESGSFSYNYTLVEHGAACSSYVESQMNYLSGNRTVRIDDVDDLIDSVLQSIHDALNERMAVFGSYQEDRTRYVFERTLVLPEYGEADIALFVYELPGDAS